MQYDKPTKTCLECGFDTYGSFYRQQCVCTDVCGVCSKKIPTRTCRMCLACQDSFKSHEHPCFYCGKMIQDGYRCARRSASGVSSKISDPLVSLDTHPGGTAGKTVRTCSDCGQTVPIDSSCACSRKDARLGQSEPVSPAGEMIHPQLFKVPYRIAKLLSQMARNDIDYKEARDIRDMVERIGTMIGAASHLRASEEKTRVLGGVMNMSGDEHRAWRELEKAIIGTMQDVNLGKNPGLAAHILQVKVLDFHNRFRTK